MLFYGGVFLLGGYFVSGVGEFLGGIVGVLSWVVVGFLLGGSGGLWVSCVVGVSCYFCVESEFV